MKGAVLGTRGRFSPRPKATATWNFTLVFRVALSRHGGRSQCQRRPHRVHEYASQSQRGHWLQHDRAAHVWLRPIQELEQGTRRWRQGLPAALPHRDMTQQWTLHVLQGTHKRARHLKQADQVCLRGGLGPVLTPPYLRRVLQRPPHRRQCRGFEGVPHHCHRQLCAALSRRPQRVATGAKRDSPYHRQTVGCRSPMSARALARVRCLRCQCRALPLEAVRPAGGEGRRCITTAAARRYMRRGAD